MILLSQLVAILAVFGLLAAFVWIGSRKRILLPGFRASRAAKSLEIIDQLRLTPQVSIHLVRCRDLEVLVTAAPGGCSLVEVGPVESRS